jgi:hypothetical protein
MEKVIWTDHARNKEITYSQGRKRYIYFLTYSLTYPTEQRPSWEANRFSASQEILRKGSLTHLQMTTNCHYPESARSSPCHHIPLSKDPSYYYPPSTPVFCKWSLSLRFAHQNPVHTERDILHSIKGSNFNWIFHILRGICLLKHVIVGKIQRTGQQGRKRKQVLYDLQNKRRYCKVKDGAVDRTLWRSRFGDCLHNSDRVTIECNYFPAHHWIFYDFNQIKCLLAESNCTEALTC